MCRLKLNPQKKSPFHRHEGCSHLILESNIQIEFKQNHNACGLSQRVANIVVALTQPLINYFGVQVNQATASVANNIHIVRESYHFH